MSSIKDKKWLVLTEKDKITERLPSSAQQPTIEINLQETVPYVMANEVMHAFKQMKDGKHQEKMKHQSS